MIPLQKNSIMKTSALDAVHLTLSPTQGCELLHPTNLSMKTLPKLWILRNNESLRDDDKQHQVISNNK